MKRAIFFILMILISAVIFGQQMMGPPAGQCNFTAENGMTEFPFELVNNHIIITANLNGDNLVRLVLDTGFPAHGAMLYKTEQIEKLNLQYSGKAMIGSPGGELKPADILMEASLSFPGVEFVGQYVIVAQHDEISLKRFSYHDGVIGYSVLSRFVVDIDFNKKIIKLSKPENFQYKGKGEELKIEFERNTPIISCQTSLQNGVLEPVKMVIDLGATHALSLDVQKEKQIVPPPRHLKSKAAGVSGEFDIILGRIDGFQIGKFCFKNVLISFNDKQMSAMHGSYTNGNLGMDILKRFHLIIDYTGSRIFLEPNNYFNDTFETNMSGIRYYRNKDKQVVIENVYDDSPARESGLKKDDMITMIDGKTVEDISNNELIEILRQKGEILELSILREGRNINKKIKLRRMI